MNEQALAPRPSYGSMTPSAAPCGGVVALLLAAACSENLQGPPSSPPPPSPGLFVSNAQPARLSGAATVATARATASDLVYVSMAPGTIPGGRLATIRNTRLHPEVQAALADGGFDPVPIAASTGDTLDIEIELEGGGNQILVATVAASSRPIVVRTSPPPRKRDVPLNANIVVVFSEPMSVTTAATVHLTRGGVSVSGGAALSSDGLRVEFQPAQLLSPNTEYEVAVSTAARDLTGDSLSAAVDVLFKTGTSTAAAAVYTDPAAVLVVTRDGRTDTMPRLIGLRRALEFDATRYDDGRISGQYRLFYPENGWGNAGSISCFTTAGDTAWIGGLIEESGDNPETVGLETGWIVINSSVGDQLSLAAIGLTYFGWGTAQDFCNEQPTRVITGQFAGQQIWETWGQDVETGDIAIQGSASRPINPVASIEISRSSISIAAGDTIQLTAAVRDSAGHLLLSPPVSWAVSDPAIVLIEPDTTSGAHLATVKVRGTGQGDVVVTATSAAVSDTALVTVSGQLLVPYGAAGYRFKVLADSTIPGGGFEVPEFDDVAAGFSDGRAPFGDGIDLCPLDETENTRWPTDTDLLLRRTFSLPAGASNLTLSVAIDNDLQVFVNGVDVTATGRPNLIEAGFQRHGGCAEHGSFMFAVPDSVLHDGPNVLAIRARDRGVVSHFDLRATWGARP